MDKKFRVRDLRKKDQYKVDDAYLNGYARLCGVYATAVYNSLSRHADFESQECWPSMKLLAEQHNMSRPSVIKGIAELLKWNIIAVQREKDPKTKRQLPNIYALMDKTVWLPKPESRVNDIDTENKQSRVNENTRAESTSEQKPSKPRLLECIPKEKDTTIEGIAEQSSAGVQINSLIEGFKEINPNYERLYPNKSQRSALERMVKRFGFEKTRATINALPSIINQKYAPNITTPVQLENRLGELIAFYKKQGTKFVTI